MPARSGNWPLLGHDSDPVAGDPDRLHDLISYYTKMADTITSEAAVLERIGSGDTSELLGESADAIRKRSKDVSKSLTQTSGRYEAVASALATYAPALDEARSETAKAVAEAEAAAGAKTSSAAMADPSQDRPKDAPPLTDAEEAYRQNVAQWNADEGGYMHLQNTRPQTPAFALADSPVGLASWIVEKFYAWSDHDGDLLSAFSFELLIDTLMIYWATETIGSSMRSYRERREFLPQFKPGDRVRVPTAVCVWPKELVRAPRAWADRFYDVRQFTTPARGGHFPGWEAPEAYAADLQQFLRMLNGRNGTKPG